MVDLNRALRTAAQTGEITLGFKTTREAASDSRAKVVVLARNMPEEARDDVVSAADDAGVPILEFEGTNVELGPAFGKPFAVSAAAIIEPGESDVLQAVQR